MRPCTTCLDSTCAQHTQKHHHATAAWNRIDTQAPYAEEHTRPKLSLADANRRVTFNSFPVEPTTSICRAGSAGGQLPCNAGEHVSSQTPPSNQYKPGKPLPLEQEPLPDWDAEGLVVDPDMDSEPAYDAEGLMVDPEAPMDMDSEPACDADALVDAEVLIDVEEAALMDAESVVDAEQAAWAAGKHMSTAT
mgnify:CR=1 FL=1